MYSSASILVLLIGTTLHAETGYQSVWHAGVQFLPAIQRSCAEAKNTGACIGAAMAKQASAPALAFSRAIGNAGWMREYRCAGRIGIAYVVYPVRKDQGVILVNGLPDLIDVDNLAKIPRKPMLADSAYANVLAEKPDAKLSAGDRSSLHTPVILQRPDGSQQVIVNYRVRSGSEFLGHAFYAFSFDPRGRFLGPRYVAFQATTEDEAPVYPIPVKAGEKFTLALPWDVPLEFDWSVAEPGSEEVLKLAGSQNDSQKSTQLWMFTVTGEGATQVVLRYASPKLPDRVQNLPLLVKASR